MLLVEYHGKLWLAADAADSCAVPPDERSGSRPVREPRTPPDELADDRNDKGQTPARLQTAARPKVLLQRTENVAADPCGEAAQG